MRLRITLPTSTDVSLRKKLLEGVDKIEEEHIEEESWQAVCIHVPTSTNLYDPMTQIILVDPSLFKTLNELLQKNIPGSRLETLTTAATATN